MEKLTKDPLFLVALELNDIDMANFCKSNKFFNDQICKKDDIWYYILERDYDKPEVKYRLIDEILLKYPQSESW